MIPPNSSSSVPSSYLSSSDVSPYFCFSDTSASSSDSFPLLNIFTPSFILIPLSPTSSPLSIFLLTLRMQGKNRNTRDRCRNMHKSRVHCSTVHLSLSVFNSDSSTTDVRPFGAELFDSMVEKYGLNRERSKSGLEL